MSPDPSADKTRVVTRTVGLEVYSYLVAGSAPVEVSSALDASFTTPTYVPPLAR